MATMQEAKKKKQVSGVQENKPGAVYEKNGKGFILPEKEAQALASKNETNPNAMQPNNEALKTAAEQVNLVNNPTPPTPENALTNTGQTQTENNPLSELVSITTTDETGNKRTTQMPYQTAVNMGLYHGLPPSVEKSSNIAGAALAGGVLASPFLAAIEIPSAATITPKVLSNTKSIRTLLGIGSLGAVAGKVSLGKHQAAAIATKSFVNSQSNIKAIIESLNAGQIDPQKANELYSMELMNIDIAEESLKKITKSSLSEYLSGAGDDYADLLDYKYGTGSYLDRQSFTAAINKYYGIIPQ